MAWLASHGHDTLHLRDLGLQRAPDPDVFALAVREPRVLLTFDLGFGEIAAHSGGGVSVLLFRLIDARWERIVGRLESSRVLWWWSRRDAIG